MLLVCDKAAAESEAEQHHDEGKRQGGDEGHGLECRQSPVLIRVPAVTPSSRAQNRRCQTGEPSLPWVAMLSMTKAPESAEVTKKTLMRITARAEVMSAPGKRSKKLNSRVSMLPTESMRLVPPHAGWPRWRRCRTPSSRAG